MICIPLDTLHTIDSKYTHFNLETSQYIAEESFTERRRSETHNIISFIGKKWKINATVLKYRYVCQMICECILN